MKPATNRQAALSVLLIVFTSSSMQAAIMGISKPLNSDDAQSRTLTDSNWTVTVPPFPLVTNIGIGYMINADVIYDRHSSLAHLQRFQEGQWLSIRCRERRRAVVVALAAPRRAGDCGREADRWSDPSA